MNAEDAGTGAVVAGDDDSVTFTTGTRLDSTDLGVSVSAHPTTARNSTTNINFINLLPVVSCAVPSIAAGGSRQGKARRVHTAHRTGSYRPHYNPRSPPRPNPVAINRAQPETITWEDTPLTGNRSSGMPKWVIRLGLGQPPIPTNS